MSDPTLTAGEFLESARRGTLTGIRCARCGTLAVPPKEFCGTCHQRAWERVPLSGEGRVTSFTVIRVAPRGHTAEVPYAIAHVTLTEGVALLGRLIDVALDRITIGMPVHLTSSASGRAAIVFRPA